MDNGHLILIPIHEFPQFKYDVVQMLNYQWPRSEALRSRSLECSCDNLPTSLVLIDNSSKANIKEVIGHSRINYLPNEPSSVWIESVIIHYLKRGQGLGKILMEKTESYAANLGFKEAVLSTHDQQGFYEKLNYEYCSPVTLYGGVVSKFLPKLIFDADSEINKNGNNPNGNCEYDVKNDVEKNTHCTSYSENGFSQSNNNMRSESSSHDLSPVVPPAPAPPPPPPPPLPKPKISKSCIQRIDIKGNKIFMRKQISS